MKNAELRRYQEIDAQEFKSIEDFEETEQIAYRAALANGETFGCGGLGTYPNKWIIEKYHKILEASLSL